MFLEVTKHFFNPRSVSIEAQSYGFVREISCQAPWFFFAMFPMNQLVDATDMVLGQIACSQPEALTWLQERSAEDVDQNLGLIADPLEGAGQFEQAVDHLKRAGVQAAAQYANVEAISYLSRALNLISHDDHTMRYILLLAREKVYDRQGAREAQNHDLMALEKLAEALPDPLAPSSDTVQAVRQSEVALRQAFFADVTGEHLAAIAAAKTAIDAAQAAGDVRLEAMGYWQWGQVLWYKDEFEQAQTKLKQALSLAQAAGMHQVEADSLRALGVVSNLQGHYTEGRLYLEQSLDIYREIGDLQGENSTLNNLGLVISYLGDYPGARACLEQALRIVLEIGDRFGECTVLGRLGLLLHQVGNDEVALEHIKRALLISLEIDDRRGCGYSLTTMGYALADLGRPAEAIESYRQALDIRRELSDINVSMETLAGLASVYLTQGKLAQALSHVDEILSHLENNTLDGAEEPFRVYLTCYRVLQDNRDPRAAAILDTAHCLLQERAAKISEEELRRSFLENVAAHREIVKAYQSLTNAK